MYAPHILLLCAAPGDDVLGANAAIIRAREQGCRITAMMLTSGVSPTFMPGFLQRVFGRRHTQTVDAIANASRQAASALGYDFISWERAHGSNSIAPRMTAVLQTIAKAVVRTQAQAVWVPAFLGLSPDHDALNIIANQIKTAYPHLEVFEYIAPPIPIDHRRFSMMFPAKQTFELAINPTPAEATKRRRHAELLVRAGTHCVLAETERELFRPLAAYDYTRPPYGYVTGGVQSPSRKGKANGTRMLRRVLPYFNAFLRAPIPPLPPSPLPKQESR